MLPSLLNKADRLILTLPGMQTRQRKPAPPDLILKSDGPAGLLARSRDQAVASVSFHQVEGIGLVIQWRARFQLIPTRLRVW